MEKNLEDVPALRRKKWSKKTMVRMAKKVKDEGTKTLVLNTLNPVPNSFDNNPDMLKLNKMMREITAIADNAPVPNVIFTRDTNSDGMVVWNADTQIFLHRKTRWMALDKITRPISFIHKKDFQKLFGFTLSEGSKKNGRMIV
jgi:hypothetical protein